MKSRETTVGSVPQVRPMTLPTHSRSWLPAAAVDRAVLVSAPRHGLYKVFGHWRWRIQIWSERAGSIGRLGLGLAVLGGVFYLTSVLPAHWALEEREAQIAALRERLASEVQRSLQVPIGPGDELDKFYRFLPPDSEISQAFRNVYRIGVHEGLLLEQAQYRVAVEGQGRLFRYEITFPLVGTYPQIRRFLRQVSSEVPSAVADKVDFEYQDAKKGKVRAMIRLLIYTRKDA